MDALFGGARKHRINLKAVNPFGIKRFAKLAHKNQIQTGVEVLQGSPRQ